MEIVLFWWQAFKGVAVDLLIELGAVGFALSALVVLARYVEARRAKLSHVEAIEKSKQYFRENARLPLYVFGALFVGSVILYGPYRLYKQPIHSLQPTDPAFSNLSQLLEAFAVYRNAVQGTECRIEITAPNDSWVIATTVAQFSVRTSNCPTFGPPDLGRDPDARHKTMEGMKPGIVIFHAAKDDTAAHDLFLRLGNVLPLVRSYEVPTGSSEHFVWLQFGSGTMWNSEVSTR